VNDLSPFAVMRDNETGKVVLDLLGETSIELSPGDAAELARLIISDSKSSEPSCSAASAACPAADETPAMQS